MQLGYRLSKVCGSVYSNANLIFTPDGNTIISCVGNRISLYDLIHHTTTTLPYENNYNIQTIGISHNGVFLIAIDVTGHGIILNIKRHIQICKFNFKRKVLAIQFTKDDRFFVITYGHGCQIWKTPSTSVEFAPLTLIRNITGFNDDTTCCDWSNDSQVLIIGNTRICIHSKELNYLLYILS
jgi:periodic tryptophan protein 2